MQTITDMTASKAIWNGVTIEVGSTWVNNRVGGQQVTVAAVDASPASGNIAYECKEAFRFNSMKRSACDSETFLNTFKKV